MTENPEGNVIVINDNDDKGGDDGGGGDGGDCLSTAIEEYAMEGIVVRPQTASSGNIVIIGINNF
jgi:hypothetical protein